MDILFEQKIVQNEALAAEMIWQAVYEAFEIKKREEGVPLLLTFLILPAVFHRQTTNALANKTQPGALYKALAQNPEIIVGYQERMQSLSSRTLRSLSVGFDSGLLQLDVANSHNIVPLRKTLPIEHATAEIRSMLSAAKRMGQALAEMTPAQLLTHLNVRF